MHYTLQAEAAAKKGTTVIDVRPANEYKRGRIPGAVNCEFYRPITGKHWVLCTSRHCMRWWQLFWLSRWLSWWLPLLPKAGLVVWLAHLPLWYAPRGAPTPVAAASLPPPASCSAASTLCRTACITLPHSALLQAGTLCMPCPLHWLSRLPFRYPSVLLQSWHCILAPQAETRSPSRPASALL